MNDLRKRGLGRGLGALIPGAPAVAERLPAVADSERVAALSSITPNPFQPREIFDPAAIDDLTASIREKGLLQPLLVRRAGDGYQLIAGERRFRAAQRAGLTEVPITIRDVDDGEALELALIENLQRENLNPVEEARAYRRLAGEFHLSQEDIAQRVGKSRSAVTNSIRLLQLAPDVLARLESGELSAGHARSLLGIEPADAQSAVAREVAAKRLSVRDTEELVRRRASATDDDLERRAVEGDLARALGTKVHLKHRADGTGRIVVEYFSLDELDGLLSRFGAR
ncbi:MAG: ParB/RepB/Spo0J family partition protein [bacterium]